MSARAKPEEGGGEADGGFAESFPHCCSEFFDCVLAGKEFEAVLACVKLGDAVVDCAVFVGAFDPAPLVNVFCCFLEEGLEDGDGVAGADEILYLFDQ